MENRPGNIEAEDLKLLNTERENQSDRLRGMILASIKALENFGSDYPEDDVQQIISDIFDEIL